MKLANSFALVLGKTWSNQTRLLERFSHVERHELEQAALRVGIVGLVLVYLIYQAVQSAGDTATEVAWVALGTFTYSLALLARILYSGGKSVARRVSGMFVDNAATSYCLLQMEATGAIIIGVYLFITFGNGFRYGRKYLHLCQSMAIVGFGGVIALSEYWRSHASLSIGLLIALAVLPFYVAVLAQRITEAMHRAAEANRAKGRFLANMSHEMRTPLNGVIAMADVLRETSLNESQVEIVETMTTSAQLLLAQIEDVLDMAKIEAGRIAIERRAFSLSRLLDSTAKLLTPQARYKNLDLQLRIDERADRWFEGDPHHLRQVVLNLVSNAIKFTERGHVLIGARLAPSNEQGDKGLARRIRIEVRDTGVGIPRDKQSLIFEPFTQADNSVTRVYGGTGLGTTIARHLVGLMGGTIGVESTVGKGSLFWIEIPLLQIQAPTVSEDDGIPRGVQARAFAQLGAGRQGTQRAGRAARILVAEDNATNQRVAQLILESRGHQVHIVENGEKALDALNRARYDIALFDLSMPVVSGLEALKLYRYSSKEPIPVLILSANVTPEAIEECVSAGAAEFVPKPLRASVLLDAIERHVQATRVAIETHVEFAQNDVESRTSERVCVLDPIVLGDLGKLSSDPTFLDRLLLGFRDDAQRLAQEIQQAVSERRIASVQDCGHALKGGAASVGAWALAGYAERLEKATAESLNVQAEQWAQELAGAITAVSEQIDKHLQERAERMRTRYAGPN